MLGRFFLEAASVTRVLVRRHLLLFAFLGFLRCFWCLEGASPVELSLFLLIGLLFALLLIMSFVLLFVCWFPVGQLLLLRDWESVSSCNLVWLDLVFLWCTGGEGCPSVLVLKSSGPITLDSRSEVSSLLKFGFGLCMDSFDGSEAERCGKLIDHFRYELFECGSALVLKTGSLF